MQLLFTQIGRVFIVLAFCCSSPLKFKVLSSICSPQLSSSIIFGNLFDFFLCCNSQICPKFCAGSRAAKARAPTIAAFLTASNAGRSSLSCMNYDSDRLARALFLHGCGSFSCTYCSYLKSNMAYEVFLVVQ